MNSADIPRIRDANYQEPSADDRSEGSKVRRKDTNVPSPYDAGTARRTLEVMNQREEIIRAAEDLGYDSSQVVRSIEEINENTRIFIGSIVEPVFFNRLGRIEHVYTTYPDKEVNMGSVDIGGESLKKIADRIEESGTGLSNDVKDMVGKLMKLPRPRHTVEYVELGMEDLGFSDTDTPPPTTEQVYARAQKLGLGLLPAEAGLQYTDQHSGEEDPFNRYFCSEPVPNSSGDPLIISRNITSAYTETNDPWLMGARVFSDQWDWFAHGMAFDRDTKLVFRRPRTENTES